MTQALSANRGYRQRPLRAKVIQNGKVMWRKIPNDICVTLDHTEADSYRVEIKELAESACIHERLDVPHCARVDDSVINHQQPIVFIRKFQQLECLLRARSEWLLDEYVLAGA